MAKICGCYCAYHPERKFASPMCLKFIYACSASTITVENRNHRYGGCTSWTSSITKSSTCQNWVINDYRSPRSWKILLVSLTFISSFTLALIFFWLRAPAFPKMLWIYYKDVLVQYCLERVRQSIYIHQFDIPKLPKAKILIKFSQISFNSTHK